MVDKEQAFRAVDDFLAVIGPGGVQWMLASSMWVAHVHVHLHSHGLQGLLDDDEVTERAREYLAQQPQQQQQQQQQQQPQQQQQQQQQQQPYPEGLVLANPEGGSPQSSFTDTSNSAHPPVAGSKARASSSQG